MGAKLWLDNERWNLMMNDPQARARDIVAHLPKGECHALEIGVWRGANASRILKWHKGVHLTLVDPWAPADPRGSYATSGSSDSRLDAAGFEAVYQKALHNLSPYKGRFTIVRADSATAASLIERNFDLVFIDGDHSYEGCALDIALWAERTKVIGGHDYGKASFPGVTRAVKEFFGPDGYTLGLDSIWWAK